MAIVNGYATLPEFKAWIAETISDEDAVLEQAVEAASRWIDGACGRRFYQDDDAERVFDAVDCYQVRIDDVRSVSAVVTDDNDDGVFETTWAAGDYQLARTASVLTDDRPYRLIRAVGSRRWPTPRLRTGLVKVTGDWGWAAIPDDVHQACLIQASRLLKRRNSPEGVTGFGNEFGLIRVSSAGDPDVTDLLRPYNLTSVLVA